MKIANSSVLQFAQEVHGEKNQNSVGPDHPYHDRYQHQRLRADQLHQLPAARAGHAIGRDHARKESPGRVKTSRAFLFFAFVL